MPLVPLKTPIQRGWVRYFVLREDVRESVHADFYTEFLKKINVYMYSNNKTFSKKKRKKSKKYIVTTPQYFVSYDENSWQRVSKKFSEREKAHYVPKMFWDSKNKCEFVRYVFDEPWRFVLRIRPNLITHTRTIDLDLESQFQRIQNYIQNNYLIGKICRIVYEKKFRYHEYEVDVNPLKNKTLVSIMFEFNEEKNENNLFSTERIDF